MPRKKAIPIAVPEPEVGSEAEEEPETTQEEELANVEPLSDQDIIAKCRAHGVRIQFVPYEIFRGLEKIEDVIPSIVLYGLHIPCGHWVALFINEQGLNYFDPLGHIPDELMKTNYDESDPGRRHREGADFTYLTNLLADYCDRTKSKIIFNEKPLQGPKTNTCGYWCTVRLCFGSMTNDQFNKTWMRKFPNQTQRELAIVKLYNKL